MTSYSFITKSSQDNSIFIPTQTISFFQVASFANPKTKLYHIRKFKINNQNEIIKVSDHHIKQNIYDEFLKQKKNTQYKMYSVYNIDMVSSPSQNDIDLSRSTILATNNTHTGYALYNPNQF